MASFEFGPKLPFAYKTYGQHATMPQTVVESPQSCIRDMLPGQWGLGQPDSVHWDLESGLLIVDTFDTVDVVGICHANLTIRPIVQAVYVEEVNKFGYIADLRNIANILRLRVFEGYKAPYEFDAKLNERYRMHGTTILAGVMLDDNGSAHWSGKEQFENSGFELAAAVDGLLSKSAETGIPQIAPHALAAHNYKEMDDGMGGAKIIDGLNEYNGVL